MNKVSLQKHSVFFSSNFKQNMLSIFLLICLILNGTVANWLEIKEKSLDDVEDAKAMLLNYHNQHGVNAVLKGLVDSEDFSSLSKLTVAFAKKRWLQYSKICLRRFKSRTLCFSNNVPFYTWQQLEIKRLRKEILGFLWDLYATKS